MSIGVKSADFRRGCMSSENQSLRFDGVRLLVTEDRAVWATAEMLDQFSRLFQRTLRQLNSHRLAKLKALKLQAEMRKLGGKVTGDGNSAE